MKTRHFPSFALLILLSSCGPQRQPQRPTKNVGSPLLPAPSAPPAVSNKPAHSAQAPKSPVDPKSTEAAINLAQRFADLLNQRKLDEAYMLLGPNAPSRSAFQGMWEQFDTYTVKIGTPGEQEGAAGSIYLSVPLNVSAVGHGEGIRRSGTLIVRRVNDVPGSTEAQRHWHIERIDWGSGA